MSYQDEVRALMERTGWSYQQVWNALRELAERPRRLSEEKGWPVSACRELYAQAGFDPNADLSWGAVVEETMCGECLEDFPHVNAHPYDRATRGEGIDPPKFCFRCRSEAGGVSECLRCEGPILGKVVDEFCDDCKDWMEGQ